ncbi:MAG: PEGA domain-containing protein [Deltaproteobacteria bacterium]|nr:PEGA domain-containing protein [Deltaproteobacteria bacterium]
MKTRTALLTLAAAVMLPYSGAGAAEFNSLMIFPYQPVYGTVPDDIGTKTSELVQNEIANNERIKLVPAPKLQTAAPAAAEEARIDHNAIKKALGQVKNGASEVKAQNFDRAIKLLKDAGAVLERNAEYLDDLSPLIEAYLNLSMAYLGSGEEEAGEDLITHVVRLDPKRQLDPKEFVPLFLRIFDARRKSLYNQPRGSIFVNAMPAGASITIDGKPVGNAPAYLKDLIRGEHYLKIEKPGEPPRYKRVSVPGGSQIEVKIEFAGAGGPGGTGPEASIAQGIRNNKLDPKVRDEAKLLAQKAGADYVVLGGVTKAENMYQVNSYIIKVKTAEIAPLVTLFFDPDMLGASIEIYKMVEEIAKKFDAFPEGMRQSTVLVVPGIMKPEEKPVDIVVGPTGAPPALPSSGEPPPEEQPQQPAMLLPAVTPTQPSQPAQPTPITQAAPQTQPPKEDFKDGGRGGRQIKEKQQIDPSIVIVEKPTHWYTSWWFWTAVGVVAVGAGVGTTVYILSIEPDHGEVVATW